MHAIPPFLTNYALWLGIAGALLVLSFLTNKRNLLQSVAGFFAAASVLAYLFTKF